MILEAMQETFPDITPHDLDAYQIVSEKVKHGDVAMRIANVHIPEVIFELGLKKGSDTMMREFSQEGTTARYLAISEHPVQTLPKLLMYHDSFTFALMPFLADHFSTATFLRVKDTGKGVEYDISYVDIVKPDIVVIEFTERFVEWLLFLPDL